MGEPTAILGDARNNTFALLMPTKARDEGQKELDTNLIKITSLQRGRILQLITVLFTNSIQMPQAFKIPDAKAGLEKECGKMEKILAWQVTKVRNKKEVIEEARNEGKTVHFASLMDLCHLKNSELEPQHQKYKCRVVLRCDIVEDDFVSYAVFIEQGSSASQMTAAKVMDIISRLPGCSGQAADAVSAYTQAKMEDSPTLFLNSKVRMSRYLDTSTTTQMAQIIVQYGRPSVSSRKESERSSSGRTTMGKAV